MFIIRRKLTLFKAFVALIVLYTAYVHLVAFRPTDVISRRSHHVTWTDNSGEILNRRSGTHHQEFEFWKYGTKRDKMFYIAFSSSEQLSKATSSLIALAALATHGERQVVVPLVDNSTFMAAELNNHIGIVLQLDRI